LRDAALLSAPRASLDPRRSPGNFDPRVTDFRFMNPQPGFYPYPGGYGVYMNPKGQIVNPPFTGRTIPHSDPWVQFQVSEIEMNAEAKYGGIDRALIGIVGEQLSSVTFVMDYWQLSFDGDVLTVYSAVAVRGQGWSVSDRDDQFRNRLCERIGHIVMATEFHARDCIVFRFDDGGTVEVSLREHDYHGPEAMNFRPRNTHLFYVI
jgi:hypothetical protein